MNLPRVTAKTLFTAFDLVVPRLRGPRILIYHQVGSGRTHEMNVTIQAFRRQLDWIQSNGTIVPLEDAVARRGDADSHRLFVLTFDDGYADVFENAFPILKERQIPFTLYITSGPIEKLSAFPDWPGEPLNWSQVNSMIQTQLVTVGAHTHSHVDLRSVDQSVIVDELDRSNTLIAERTGVFPNHFTYPKGWWATQAHEPIRQRYLTATVGGGESITESSDLHRLARVPVQRSDVGPLFGRKMHAGGQVEGLVRRRLRG